MSARYGFRPLTALLLHRRRRTRYGQPIYTAPSGRRSISHIHIEAAVPIDDRRRRRVVRHPLAAYEQLGTFHEEPRNTTPTKLAVAAENSQVMNSMFQAGAAAWPAAFSPKHPTNAARPSAQAGRQLRGEQARTAASSPLPTDLDVVHRPPATGQVLEILAHRRRSSTVPALDHDAQLVLVNNLAHLRRMIGRHRINAAAAAAQYELSDWFRIAVEGGRFTSTAAGVSSRHDELWHRRRPALSSHLTD